MVGPRRFRRLVVLRVALLALALVGCSTGASSQRAAQSATAPSVAPATPAATATPFATLPPGTTLPTEEECAARVRRSPWEPRPENNRANRTTPASLVLGEWSNHSERANRELLPRITGNFTGTTDEILQWGACKWGFDEDLVRAVAVQESDWRQAMVGDIEDDPEHCAPGYSVPCPTSFGITQVRWYIWPGTFPHARDSTALAIDYWGGLVRSCYEGYVDWLHAFTDAYVVGDLWGCVGFWYLGRWYEAPNREYIARVQRRLAVKEWLSPTFTEAAGSVARRIAGLPPAVHPQLARPPIGGPTISNKGSQRPRASPGVVGNMAPAAQRHGTRVIAATATTPPTTPWAPFHNPVGPPNRAMATRQEEC